MPPAGADRANPRKVLRHPNSLEILRNDMANRSSILKVPQHLVSGLAHVIHHAPLLHIGAPGLRNARQGRSAPLRGRSATLDPRASPSPGPASRYLGGPGKIARAPEPALMIGRSPRGAPCYVGSHPGAADHPTTRPCSGAVRSVRPSVRPRCAAGGRFGRAVHSVPPPRPRSRGTPPDYGTGPALAGGRRCVPARNCAHTRALGTRSQGAAGPRSGAQRP